MTQLTLDDEVARRQAEEGMQIALEHAERKVNQWGDLAYVFLESFCRKTSSFISEDVSAASKAYGMAQPPTDRAWGSVYRRAIKANLIVMDGTGYSNRRHRSLCPRWRSLIYGIPAS